MTITKENFEETREPFNTLKYYEETKNKMNAEEILKMLEREIPLQVQISALMIASIPDNANNIKKALSTFKNKLKEDPDNKQIRETIARLERELQGSSQGEASKEEKRIKRDITYLENELKKNPDDESAKKMLEQLTEELKNGEYGYNYNHEFLNLFDENKLRERLHFLFAPYLEFLDENNKNGLQEALNIIEENISKRDKILSEMKAQLKPKDTQAMEKPTSEEPSYGKLRTSKAKELLYNRTRVDKEIRKDSDEFYSEQGVEIKTGQIGKRKRPIYTPVLLNYIVEELEKQGLSVDGVGHLDAFDMEILMHAESLYSAGNKFFTADMLASQMSGGKRVQVTPKMKNEIYKSLMRLRLTNITINTQSEYDLGYNNHVIFSGAILPNKIEGEPIMLNGKKVMEYVYVLDNSPITKYAHGKNQISRPPVSMLDVPLNLTKENIILTGYLARRIIDMQAPENWKGKYIILYETIFDYLKLKDENPNTLKVTQKRIREDVRAILEKWKKDGIIKDFEELGEDDKPPKNRAPIVKIKIKMPKLQPKIIEC